ncbi:hypothetical protein CRENBAI_024641 [Crenichthys baileyi]|uniref:BED-type domain-containing protein n=1 Tax=Crenichthys baileyi TaxID=28760 RepID=A0AAV9S9F7_9TELE
MSYTCAAAPACHTLHRKNTAHKHSLHAACTQTTAHVQTITIMVASVSTHVSVPPFVITFGYKNFTQAANKRAANCIICDIKIQNAGSTTTNFICHLKSHPERKQHSSSSSSKSTLLPEGSSSLESLVR